jgi:hypothetical protein
VLVLTGVWKSLKASLDEGKFKQSIDMMDENDQVRLRTGLLTSSTTSCLSTIIVQPIHPAPSQCYCLSTMNVVFTAKYMAHERVKTDFGCLMLHTPSQTAIFNQSGEQLES